MAAITSIVAGATTLASTGMSFAQMQKARNLQTQAQSQAKKAIEDARKRLEVNYYDTLSVVKEPYELEREALLSQGAQAIEAARESTRGVSETAGRIQMAQNAQQGNIRTAMGREVAALDKLSATEDSRLRDANVIINKDIAEGAQLASANAWEMEQRAMQQGFMGATKFAGQLGSLLPENWNNALIQTESPQAPQGTNVAGGINAASGVPQIDITQQAQPQMNGMNLNPIYQGKTYEEILMDLQNQGAISPNRNEWDLNAIMKQIYQ